LLFQLLPAFGIPAGFMTWFDAIACPPGWAQPPQTMGRMILSVTSLEETFILVNAPLGEQEIREHSHTASAAVNIPVRQITAPVIPCCDTRGACSGTYTASSKFNTTSGDTPFTQLLLCELLQDSSDIVPVGTVGYYNASQCPTDWAPYTGSEGRFLLAGYSYEGIVQSQEPAISAGEDPGHTHYYSSSITTESVDYLSDSACCNDILSQNGTYNISGKADYAPSGLPYISLLTCTYQQNSFASQLPSATLLFNQIACPPGWNVSIEAAGRFLVSVPSGGTPGVSFGGKSLEPGFSTGAIHSHVYQGSLPVPGCSVDALIGITAFHYAASGTYTFNGLSDSSTMGLPFIAMPLCVQFKSEIQEE